jgi:hypothetical protein
MVHSCLRVCAFPLFPDAAVIYIHIHHHIHAHTYMHSVSNCMVHLCSIFTYYFYFLHEHAYYGSALCLPIVCARPSLRETEGEVEGQTDKQREREREMAGEEEGE